MNSSSHDPADLTAALLREDRWLRGLALRLVRDREGAQDAVQATWAAALSAAPTVGPGLRGWLATVLQNRVRQDARGAGRRVDRERAAARAERTAATDDLVAEADVRAVLAQAVMELPEGERTVVVLHFYRERRPARIAAELGISESTVRRRLADGLARLRARLDASAGDEAERWERALVVLAFPRGRAAAAAGALPAALLATVAIVGAVVGLRAWQGGGDPTVVPSARPTTVAAAAQTATDPGTPVPAVSTPVERRPAPAPAAVQEAPAASDWLVVLRDGDDRPVTSDGGIVALAEGGREIEGVERLGPDRYRIPVRERGLVRIGVRRPGFALGATVLDARASLDAPEEPAVIRLRPGRLVEVTARAADGAPPPAGAGAPLLTPIVHLEPLESLSATRVAELLEEPLVHRPGSSAVLRALASEHGIEWLEVFPAGPVQVSLCLDGVPVATREVEDGVEQVDFELAPELWRPAPVVLTARVVDVDGAPVARAGLAFELRSGRGSRSAQLSGDDQGWIEGSLPPGAYTASLHGPHGAQPLGAVAIEPGRRNDLGLLVHRPGRSVTGRVESDGAAVAGAWIEALPLGPGAGFPSKPLRIEGFPDLPGLARGTGADGRFEQITWAERSAWIACADDGRRMSPPVEVVPTAEPSVALELALRPTRTLTVTPPKARWWAEELTVRHRPTGIALWVRPYRAPAPLEVRVPEGEYVLELRDRVEGRVLEREVTVADDDLTLDLGE